MARIFLSHSSGNNAEAIAVRDWLISHGWRSNSWPGVRQSR